MSEFLTVEQVADMLQLTPQTIYAKIRNGVIPTHPWSEKPRIPLDALKNWDVDTNETFKERKLKKEIEDKDQEILNLKNKIRQITRIGLEVNI